MAILTITESCPIHIAHGDNIPLNCFDEATGAFLAILVETAPVEDIIHLTKSWLRQGGNDSVSVEFTDISGAEISVTYSV